MRFEAKKLNCPVFVRLLPIIFNILSVEKKKLFSIDFFKCELITFLKFFNEIRFLPPHHIFSAQGGILKKYRGDSREKKCNGAEGEKGK